MELPHVLIFSLVEGITEFLPISSTGHLVLTSEILRIPQTDFVKSFEIIIQLGAILAVVFLYWRKILESKILWKNILIAFIPTAIVGLTLYSFIKDVLIGNVLVTLLALFVGGIVLIALEFMLKQKEQPVASLEKFSLKTSFLIGLIQSLSIIPGVSRAGASIVGGMVLGLKRNVAVEFSFLLAIPTMFAATGLDLIKSELRFSPQEWLLLLIGFVGSFIVALAVVKWFIKYVQTNNLIPFGIYRIVLALIFSIFIFF
jgi:undecaprenyl-diphosphatase